MSIEIVDAASVADLVEKVVAKSKTSPTAQPLWFRGIPTEAYRLLPSLLRDGRAADDVFERERRLLTRFRQRSMAYWPSGYPQNDWEHLFAMQHFGVPTRLLDWTENLFVAAYFALSSRSDRQPDGLPCVWVLDPVAWNRAMPALSEFGESIRILTIVDEESESYRPETQKKRQKSPVAIFGSHNSGRIVAQRGTFTVWGSEPKPMEDFVSHAGIAPLWKIRLAGNPQDLLLDLQRIGFSETMIFPELQSLASELTRMEGWR